MKNIEINFDVKDLIFEEYFCPKCTKKLEPLVVEGDTIEDFVRVALDVFLTAQEGERHRYCENCRRHGHPNYCKITGQEVALSDTCAKWQPHPTKGR